jgi:hypothetical protein
MWVIDSSLDIWILIKTKGYPHSNLDRSTKFRRPGWFLLRGSAREEQSTGRSHGRRWRGLLIQPTVRQTSFWLFLHDLGNKENSFCKLTTKEMGSERLAVAVWLGRSSTAVGAASDGAPVPRICRDALPWGPCWPPMLQMWWAAADLLAHGEGLVAMVLPLWWKSGQEAAVFIGVSR